MYAPRQVARTMIDRASAKGIPLSNLTLQKLLYIAHGCRLAIRDQPLINQNFSAWRYGPVVEDLYHDLKVFGANNIRTDDHYIARWTGIPASDTDSIGIIDLVLDHFGKWSGASLIEWSHRPDGPWSAVYNNKELGSDIPDPAIKQFFTQHVIKQ